MMTCFPRLSAIFWPIVRARISAVPPGGVRHDEADRFLRIVPSQQRLDAGGGQHHKGEAAVRSFHCLPASEADRLTVAARLRCGNIGIAEPVNELRRAEFSASRGRTRNAMPELRQ